MKKLKRIAALTLAAACAATVCAGAAFTDQSDIKVDSRVIDTLVEKNVIRGYENGSFQPNETVSRAEMAKMIYVLRTNGGTDATTYAVKMSTDFNDVNNHWASGYIKYCYAYGIVAGKSSTVFAPDAPVTTVEAAKMLLVYSGVDAAQSGLTGAQWKANTMKLADQDGLLKGVEADIDAPLPRQYAAQIVIRGLALDTESKSVMVDGEAVRLTPLEYKILELLCRHPGKVFSTEEIYRQVWNDDIVSDNAIAVHVRHIREKIEINPKEPRYLKVVWGVGYKIERSE